MDTPPKFQELFFQQIKAKMPVNLSFVHEIASLLEISYDSAYRRIRGEKELSMEEIFRLSQNFNVSLDSLMGVKANNVVFQQHPLTPGKFTIKDWLSVILADIRRIHQAKEKEIIYAAKDPPVFHYFQFPEIAAFKIFFWEKTLFDFPEYKDKLFRIDGIDPVAYDLGQTILRTSTKIPTIEIWNEDTFIMLLRQIEYYWISGYFEKKDDMLNLICQVEKWIRHIQSQADHGFKYLYDSPPEGIENSFMLYENEVVLNDNTIFVKLDNTDTVYLTYNVLSLLITQEPSFCKSVELYLKGLLKKSNLISLSGSKERNRFFNKMLYTIDQSRSRLGLS